MRSIIGITTLAVVAASLNCGEPVEPVGFLWRKAATVPAEYQDFQLCGVGPRGLYIIAGGQNPDIDRLLVFNGTTFDVDYEGAPNERLVGAAFWGNAGFLGMIKETGISDDSAVFESHLLKLKDGVWTDAGSYP
jgi:hypothetical protein